MEFVTLREAELLAKKRIKNKTFQWLQSGAEDNYTLDKNFLDLKKIKIKPKHLNKVGALDLSKDFFGKKISSPVLLAPMGHQTQFHKNGEIETALGVEKAKSIAFFSTQGRISLNDIRKKNKSTNLGWTIFPFGDENWILKEIKSAEKNKCVAIIICIDANVRSWRYNDRESRYDARKFGRRTNPLPPNPKKALSYDWKLINFIKKNTKLPIILKGILTKEDAIKCVKKKIDAVWISNHGGRMFNSGISGIDAIKNFGPLLKKSKLKIIVDGGIRKGSDIIKYMCLGADFVAVGRPIIHGLVCNNRKGVKKIFDILSDELKTSMINGGFSSYKDLKSNRLSF
jgi:isopentenyl diphosphate isomerase/L-lactate dehydrogenase-like FMN-dependent dehydrogenase